MRHLLPIASLVALLAACDDAPSYDVPTDLGPRSLGRVHVEQGRLVDAWGREVTLRGTNLKVPVVFDVLFQDGRTMNEVVPPWNGADEAVDMAYQGFDFVRLCLTWSGLEPVEGQLSETYLAALDAVVDDLSDAGLYVLLDFHEDAYSKEIGEDGAPAWAIVTPYTPLGGPIYDGPGLSPPFQDLTVRRTAQSTLDAFTAFFQNQGRIQERFMPALRAIGGRYRGRATIVGLEDMNEPVAIQVPDQQGVPLLEAFHDRSLAALREVEPDLPLWVEPEVVNRNVFLSAPLREKPMADRNVVYAPHLYPPWGTATTYDEFVAKFTDTFDGMVQEGASYGGATVIGEWWSPLTNAIGVEYVDAVHTLAEQRNIGLAMWLWKGYSGQLDPPGSGSSGAVYDFDYQTGEWFLNTVGVHALSRPYAIAVPGRITRQSFDRTTSTFAVDFDARAGAAAPLVYLPAHRAPKGWTVTLDGRAVSASPDASTQRALVPWNGDGGPHTLVLAPSP